MSKKKHAYLGDKKKTQNWRKGSTISFASDGFIFQHTITLVHPAHKKQLTHFASTSWRQQMSFFRSRCILMRWHHQQVAQMLQNEWEISTFLLVHLSHEGWPNSCRQEKYNFHSFFKISLCTYCNYRLQTSKVQFKASFYVIHGRQSQW